MVLVPLDEADYLLDATLPAKAESLLQEGLAHALLSVRLGHTELVCVGDGAGGHKAKEDKADQGSGGVPGAEGNVPLCQVLGGDRHPRAVGS